MSEVLYSAAVFGGMVVFGLVLAVLLTAAEDFGRWLGQRRK